MAEAIDFTAQPRRGRFEAWLLDATAKGSNAQHGRRKQEVIGAMQGTVVEIGPGAGANMPYYGDGVHVIGIEPNPAMHERLRSHAEANGVDLEIRMLRGEHLDVDDASVDGVVGTLVLCGVTDQGQVVSEIRRVLRPGGTYFFIEHVGARPGSTMRRIQKVLNRPHRWLLNGCEVHRDTAAVIESAGFAAVDLEHTVMKPGLYLPDFIIGTATR
jgi:SAM-dependent methyltransferase